MDEDECRSKIRSNPHGNIVPGYLPGPYQTLERNGSRVTRHLCPRGDDLHITFWKLLPPGDGGPRFVYGCRSKIRSNPYGNTVPGYLLGPYQTLERNGSRISRHSRLRELDT